MPNCTSFEFLETSTCPIFITLTLNSFQTNLKHSNRKSIFCQQVLNGVAWPCSSGVFSICLLLSMFGVCSVHNICIVAVVSQKLNATEMNTHIVQSSLL